MLLICQKRLFPSFFGAVGGPELLDALQQVAVVHGKALRVFDGALVEALVRPSQGRAPGQHRPLVVRAEHVRGPGDPQV